MGACQRISRHMSACQWLPQCIVSPPDVKKVVSLSDLSAVLKADTESDTESRALKSDNDTQVRQRQIRQRHKSGNDTQVRQRARDSRDVLYISLPEILSRKSFLKTQSGDLWILLALRIDNSQVHTILNRFFKSSCVHIHFLCSCSLVGLVWSPEMHENRKIAAEWAVGVWAHRTWWQRGKNTIFTNLKENIRAHRASSKATRLFLTMQ